VIFVVTVLLGLVGFVLLDDPASDDSR